jgi:protein tyrosine/serine phosphatase
MEYTSSSLGLIPLVNFGAIAPNLYRSAQPEHLFQYRWLNSALGINRVFNLRSEKDMDTKRFYGLGAEVFTVAVADHQPPNDEQAIDFMDRIREDMELTAEGSILRTPTLIHCEHGYGRTSTFSVLAKMALGQTYVQAIADEADRFHFEFRHKGQSQWLEDFAERLKIVA